MALTTQTKLQIIELRAEGLPYAKIAEEVKVSKQTAVDVVGESRDQIATLQAIQMEALFEAQRVNLRGRVEQLSALQRRLLEEIERRDLSDLSTDKLITLYLNTTKNLKEEVFTTKMETTTEQAETSRQREIFNKW